MHNLKQDVYLTGNFKLQWLFHLKFEGNCYPALIQLSVLIIYTPQAQESSVYMGKGLALVDAWYR